MKKTHRLDLIIEHYKKIFLKYFFLPKRQVDLIFSKKKLLIAPLGIHLEKYHGFSKVKYLNCLAILEFISLALIQHDQIKNTSKNSILKKNQLKLIETQSTQQILLGDLLIVLAIQEVNRLNPAIAKVFYETIKKIYHTKIENSFNPKAKTTQKTSGFLKFILFLKFYLSDSTDQTTQKQINSFYQKLTKVIFSSNTKNSTSSQINLHSFSKVLSEKFPSLDFPFDNFFFIISYWEQNGNNWKKLV